MNRPGRVVLQLMMAALVMLGASPASAQKKKAPASAAQACPTVQTSCPSSVPAGGSLTMTANVSGGDPNVTPTYNWSISSGSISGGQGTPSITVDVSGLGGSSVTATADIGGFDRSCPVASSCTTMIEAAPQARKVDEYGKLTAKQAEPRLDNFAIQLMNDPTSQGYVVGYRAYTAKAAESLKAATAAKTYLVKKRGIDAMRLMVIDGGTREQPTIELWVAENGAMAPVPTPTEKPKKPTKAKK